jgi:IS5 family transposase
LKKSYGRLLRLTRSVTSQACAVLARLSSGELSARPDAVLRVLRQENSLRHYLPLVDRVIAQTQARVFQSQRHYPEKLLSLFEAHSVVIRKGKAHKPNEFGRLVRFDEIENGIISGYEVAAGNRADQQQWAPALEHHVALFGRAPRVAAADRGSWSAHNERPAAEMGVEWIVLPGRGPLSAERARSAKRSRGSGADRHGGRGLSRGSPRVMAKDMPAACQGVKGVAHQRAVPSKRGSSKVRSAGAWLTL